jgi:hypothetical protein
MFSPEGFEALHKAYEKWKATPEGKKRLAETNKRKIILITKKELPEGWTINDGGNPDDGYVTYYHMASEIDVTIELTISAPIHFGGRQSYEVRVKELPDDDDEDEDEYERTIADFDAETNWKDSAEQAKKKALEYMKRISERY